MSFLRVVFMGTPEFAVPSLSALAERHEIVAVYTRPDAASGRGARLRPSPVKQAAIDLGIPVRQPATLRDQAESDRLQQDIADIIVVAAFGMILPVDILGAALHGSINVHASLLPRWRGAAPIHRAILAGDEVAGVSIMRMEEGLDTGPFCVTATTAVDDKTADDLTTELAELGARALIDTLDLIAAGECAWVDQDPTRVTYAQKIDKSDVALAPELTAVELARRVRASSRRAPARASVDGRGVTISVARPIGDGPATGHVAITADGIAFGALDGALLVTRIKPDGKPEMAATDWARGARLAQDSQWERT